MENKRPIIYRPDDIADMLKISTRTVYTYIRSGKLHAVKIGQYWYITQENLESFLQGDKQT